MLVLLARNGVLFCSKHLAANNLAGTNDVGACLSDPLTRPRAIRPPAHDRVQREHENEAVSLHKAPAPSTAALKLWA